MRQEGTRMHLEGDVFWFLTQITLCLICGSVFPAAAGSTFPEITALTPMWELGGAEKQ